LRYSTAIAIAAALLAPAAVQASEGRGVFKASSAWALDYGEDYCRLMRDFSNGQETVGLFVERTQPGPVMRLVVLGDGVRLYRGSQEIGYRMSPSGAPRTVQRLRYQTADGQQYLNLGPTILADVPAPVPGAPPAMPSPYTREGETALAATITGIALDRGLVDPVVLETGALGEAAGALQACADDLVASWGLDPVAHKSLTRPAMPAGPTAGWIASDAVPFADFAKLAGGNNELRMMIDASGKPTSCHVQWPTLDVAVNSGICTSVMGKAKFLPALDREGQAIDSFWTTSLFFLMPPFGGRGAG
jgi:hypothetical protein